LISARRCFQHSKAIAEIERAVAALAALLVKTDSDPALAAEPSQSAQQLVSGYAPSNKRPSHPRQASNQACYQTSEARSDEWRLAGSDAEKATLG
jgi:hypothetical protein